MKTPIVLAHGLMGLGNVRLGPAKFSYFHRIDDAIAARGHPVLAPRVHPTASIERRAGQLKQQILRAFPDGRVVIFAHSMGGLDARYMVSRLGMADRVSALVTISTPHRGSPFADWCLTNVGHRMGALAIARRVGLDLGALRDLAVSSSAAFNDVVADAAQVAYFSISAARPWHLMPIVFVPSHRVIDKQEGDNDGLVSTRSARWGEHLGTWPIDHLATINKRMIAARLGPRFDVVAAYLDILDSLRRRNLVQ